MKHFNGLRLVASFREISNVLNVVSTVIKVFALLLVVFQGIMLIAETKRNMQN